MIAQRWIEKTTDTLKITKPGPERDALESELAAAIKANEDARAAHLRTTPDDRIECVHCGRWAHKGSGKPIVHANACAERDNRAAQPIVTAVKLDSGERHQGPTAMPADHPPPSFAPDSPPDLDSRALHEQIETARAIKAVAHDAGYRSGYEAGRRDAQTEIDATTYERGVSDERGRITAIVKGARTLHVRAEILAAIRSGEPAPNT